MAAVLAWLGLCALLYAAQDSLMYYPTPPVEHAGAERIDWRHDGETLRLWKVGSGPHAVLYFGGNAENVAANVELFDGLLPDAAVYLHNYRGYGGSTGDPGQGAFYRDAEHVFDRLAESHERVSVIGRSLGSAVATWLAARRPVDKLVLVTPFDSIENVARASFPYAPVSLLLRDKYRSAEQVPAIDAPTLVLAAGDDRIIPGERTLALVERFPASQVRMRTLAGTGHNTISAVPEYAAAIRGFLAPGGDRS